jgi:hypothetical protein
MDTSISVKESTEIDTDLIASKKIDISAIQTVCLALGPYRNLTTLTASILFLHPNCQVLNHAGCRIFGNEQLDFIANYSKERFETFIQYAIHISQKGRRGDYGGSITHSHAFDSRYLMKDIFYAAKQDLLKQNVTALFWKESLRASNHLRLHKVDLDGLFKLKRQLKFIMPIRNPLDCAVSNLKTGKANIFQSIQNNSGVEQILASILEEILWFKNLESRHPERFFCFFEHDFNEDTIIRLADFLQLDPREDWCANALAAFDVKSKYIHPTNLISFFRQRVENQFSDYPDFVKKLLRFGKDQPAKSL